jgi:DegV family protein with EDD domain
MSDYVIVTESTTDLPQSLANELGLIVIPMTFKDDKKEYVNYLDGREMSSEEFYRLEREGVTFTTAQITPNHFIEVLKPILDSGKNVLIVGFSSGLSGTINSAHLAIEELKEEYPNNKVLLVDSLCASMGEGLLCWYAKQNMVKGMSLEENYKWLEEHKLNLAHWFTVSDIDFLKRGGRLSNASAFIAKALKINPVLHVDNAGHLVNRYKKIGRKTAIKEILKQFSETVDRSFKQTIFISHGDCPKDAEYLASCARELVDVEDIVISSIGPVIGAHSGPGTLAIFFMASHR